MKKVRDFMTRDLTSVIEDTPLKEVAELLSLRELSGIPVVNKENEVTGFISEKDIITSIFPEQIGIETPTVIGIMNLSQIIKKLSRVGAAMVKDYMTEKPTCVREDTPTSDVAQIMLQKNLKRLPVIRNKRLVGIVDRASLSRILLKEGSLD